MPAMAAWSAMSLLRGLLAAFMVALLVAGCSVLLRGHAVTRPGTANQRAVTPIEWSTCKAPLVGDVAVPPNAECGKLTVPVDYTKPDGDVAQLAMMRFPATGDKIGSLILNPGGPGKSGMEAAASLVQIMPRSIRDRFDIVGFDPRGVASSTPAVVCNSDADTDRVRADPGVDYSPAGVEHLESEAEAYVQRCVDKNGKAFLENVGTANVVKDLDTMRAALGDEKLTYLGYSYGTRIGALYAEQFPDKVRAMILDGALDPNADPTEADLRQAAAFQKAFNDFAADCANDPVCPLGTDPAKAVAVYQGLVDPLVERPATTSADPRGLSYGDAISGTLLPLYSPRLWHVLKEGLSQLRSGDGSTMLTWADRYMGRNAAGHYDNSTDARAAISCVDRPPVTDRAEVVDKDRRYREAAPFMSYGEFTGNAPLSACAFWPVPPTTLPHRISVSGLPPMLVVSTTNDPATPYLAGVDLAKQLGAALLTFEGTQHTVVFQGNQCVDDVAAKYLIDLSVPPPDARC
jgi:pimeloyl-ACP methyl ester carboxylesterase